MAKKQKAGQVPEIQPTTVDAEDTSESLTLDDLKPPKVKKSDGQKIDEMRSDVTGFRGGVRINLKRATTEGKTLGDDLKAHIGDILDQELKNHAQLVKNIRRDERQYHGKKKGKVFPWIYCSNLAVPETRKNVDTAWVRYTDAIFNRRKWVILKALKPELVDQVRKIEDALDWFLRHIVHYKEKLVSPLFQSLLSGTGILHTTWVSEKKVVYRYATDAEKFDPNVEKYNAEGGAKVVKEVQNTYEGPQVFPVSREDFIISSDATDIKDALLVGFRKYHRRAEVELKERQGLFFKGSMEKLAAGADKFDDVKVSRADIQGKELEPPKYGEPYEVWYLWTNYDVDGDGEEDSIVVAYHHESGTILDAMYNPVFTSTRPFVKLVGQPSAFQFDGQGLAGSIYHLQEAVDTVANQRIDRGTLLNTVVALVRAGAGKEIQNFKWQPGKVYEVEEGNLDEAIKILPVPPVPPSAFQEEAGLKQDIRELCGNSPENMGFSSADRPVFKDTMARLEEGNKRRKSFIDFIRDGIAENVYQLLELWSQYQPVLEYKENVDGEWVNQTVSIPAGAIRESIGVELAAATEVLSQDMRREVEQNAFMLVRQFNTDIGGMCQLLVDPKVPPSMKKVIIAGAQVGSKLMLQILRDFDLPDAESLVIDVTKILTPEDMTQPPQKPDLMPKIIESISYKDAPESIKRQIEAQVGFKPATEPDPAQMEMAKGQMDMQLKKAGMDLEAQKAQQGMAIERQRAEQEMVLNAQKSRHDMAMEGQRAQHGMMLAAHKAANEPKKESKGGE